MSARSGPNELDREISALHEAVALKALVQRAPPTREEDVVDHYGTTNEPEEPQILSKYPNDAYATRLRLQLSGQIDTSWCNFIDALCVLCWFRRGGESVVSIAVQERDDRARFIVTTNGPSIVEPVEHLRDMLQWLQSLSGGQLRETEVLQYITDRSITLAKDKIINYRSRLRSQLEVLRNESARAAEGWDGMSTAQESLDIANGARRLQPSVQRAREYAANWAIRIKNPLSAGL